MSKYIKSPLNYIGGKHKILDKIMPMFPQNITSFVDLFAGGLNVGINISADTIYVNEHITYLIELYEYFRKVSTEDLLSNIKGRISEYRLTNTNQEGYLELRREYNNSKNILDLFVLTCFSFNHQIRFNSKHEFNIPFGKERSSYNSSIKANLVQFVQALKEKNYVFVNGDFAKFDFEKIRKGDFVYCDPPYLITNGSYNDGKRGFKDWTMKEEEELLELLDSLDRKGILFALSNVFYHKGASNDLLIEWSKKYYTHYIDKNYSNCSYQLKDRKAKTIEVLITNFEGSQDNVR